MIKDFTPRLYQQTILATTLNSNCMVVLPTGLGKTGSAFLLAAQRLSQYPNSKILMLAPTKPLCEQHVQTFQKHLDIDKEKIVLFTGNVPPNKRAELWKNAKVVISTPQGLENDSINKRINLEEVSLTIFDEAHRATGDYSYVWLAKQYEKTSKFSRILALTASPGSDLEKIKEICDNLMIEKIEVRTEKDPDVKPYVKEVKVDYVTVDFSPELKKIQKLLKDCVKTKLLLIQKLGYSQRFDLLKGEMLGLQRELQKKVSSGFREIPILKSLSLLAEAMKVEHALELLESQGIKPLHFYFEKIKSESKSSKVKAVKNLVQDLNFKVASHLTEQLVKGKFEHPKLKKLSETITKKIQDKPDSKIIIFTQFRDTAESIVSKLDENGITNHIFVGQAKKNGLGFSQKQQKEILDKFRNGDFAVLTSTSVSEEGLDIPKVDSVYFYEPIPSAIRHIQRAGRTGRLDKGEVKIFITSGTRDEAYRWSAHHKKNRMHQNLEKIKSNIILKNPSNQPTLSQFIKENESITILADNREKDNKIVKELINLGISVSTKQLVSADYIVSGTVGVELKKVPDFVASIIDGRILDQVKDLKRNFQKCVLIIEGDEDLYSVRKIHANAIRGMLSSISLGFNVPILHTKNPIDTAQLLAVMAKREQNTDRDFSYHQKKSYSLKEQQEYIISSFPNIGPNIAKILLENCGSIKKVLNSSIEELTQIKGIGKKTAEQIVITFNAEYKKS